jgi:membrane-associated protein TcaA
MAFCNNCGNKLGTNQTFCSACGEKHEGASLVTEKTRTGQSSGFFSKKVKIGLAAVVVLAIGLFVAHQILSHRYAPENVVANFEEAVTDGDEKALLDLLHPSTKSLELDEESVAGFISYLEKESDVDELVKDLYEQTVRMEGYKKTEALTDQSGNEILTLKRGEKKFGLYPQYEIEVIPFKVEMTSNLENVELTFHGKKKKVKSPDEYVDFGEFLPGTSKVKAVYKGEYATLKDEFEIPFSEVASDNLVRFQADLEGDYVSIYSNEYEATLFVNGKSTGKTIDEIDEFGPIDTNGKVVLHAEYKTEKGKIKTEEIEVSDQGAIDLNFKEEELYWEDSALIAQETLGDGELEADMEEMIEAFMKNYVQHSVQSINERDFDIVSPFIDPAGPSYEETRNYLDYLESEGITEETTGITIRGIEQQEHGISVKTEESYNIYYNDGTGKAKTFHSEHFLTQEGNELKLHSLVKTEEIYSREI